jgi:hypothetical protein
MLRGGFLEDYIGGILSNAGECRGGFSTQWRGHCDAILAIYCVVSSKYYLWFMDCAGQLLICTCPGDIIHLNVLGQPFIVLNSHQAAVDLLDKRGANYSGRPRFPLFET